MNLPLKWGSMIILRPRLAKKHRVEGDATGNRRAPRPIFFAGAPLAGPKKCRQFGPTAGVALISLLSPLLRVGQLELATIRGIVITAS